MKNFLFASLLVGSLILSGCSANQSNTNGRIQSKQTNTNESTQTAAEGYSNTMSQTAMVADKIEVVHFHATRQCGSCITVGEFALKTIQEKFPEELKNGIIVFKEINTELPENRDTVIKYQARGSSLFVNGIKDGKDNIKEDTTVWRLASNETQFINYFENKLRKLLGK